MEVKPEVKPTEEKPFGWPDIRSAGFVSDVEYRGIGMILDSKEGKNMMSAGDITYLAFKTAEPILIGDKYTVFRGSEDMIRNPQTGKRIGRKYNILGNVQIIDMNGNFYTAKVVESFDAIQKGDMIKPYQKDKMEGIVEKKIGFFVFKLFPGLGDRDANDEGLLLLPFPEPFLLSKCFDSQIRSRILKLGIEATAHSALSPE